MPAPCPPGEGGERRRLVAISDDTFMIEDLDTFRLQFVVDSGKTTAVIGHYDDGRTDRNDRTR